MGGAALLPAMMAGLFATLALRLVAQEVRQTVYLSTVLLGCGALATYLLACLVDMKHLQQRILWYVKTGIILLLPLAGLHYNYLYGIGGILNLTPAAWLPLTIAVIALIISAFDNDEKKTEKMNIVLATLFLGIIGLRFFMLQCYTYTMMAFALAGALLVAARYCFRGDWRISTQMTMGNSGRLIVSLTVSYLAVKFSMFNPEVVTWHSDAILTPVSLLIVPVCESFRHLLTTSNTLRTRHAALLSLMLFAIAMALLHFTSLHQHYILPICLCVYAAGATIFAGELPTPDGKGNELRSTCHHSFTPGLVSVIMPTWNSKHFVGESIESILSQTYGNLELIITDDASTDGTPALLQEYAKKDKRVRLILNTQNRGAGYSRNCSIEAARGQYIAFCDSDDRWIPDKLKRQIQFMKNKNVALCFSPYYTCDAQDHYLGYVSSPRRIGLFGLMCDNKIGFLTAIYDTQLLGKRFMPEQRKRQDHAMLLTLLKQCKHAYSIDEPLAHYRIHAGNMSGSKIGLLKYNARTYNAVFGWPMPCCYLFLIVFFLPSYFWKRTKNLLINISRTQLG